MGIRPSALTIAEKCGLAPQLAEQYPETSIHADRGKAIHEEIARALLGGIAPTAQEATTAVSWARGLERNERAKIVGVEVPVRLADPETDETITEGTADLLMTEIEPDGEPCMLVIDWKTGRRENVPPTESNLQLLAYGLAAGLAGSVARFRCIAAFLDGDGVYSDESRTWGAAEWWPLLDRVRSAASRPPVASPGPHCGGCWQRPVCPSYRERAATALILLREPPGELALTDETATELVMRLKAVRDACDLAEDMAKAHVRGGGRIVADGQEWRPQMVNGRRSGPSLKELEAQGLGHLIKAGAPSERWGWAKVRP